MGVLSSFSIAKKISEEEVNQMIKSAKTKTKNQGDAMDIVKAKIMKEIIDASKKGTMPGIVLDRNNEMIPIQHIEDLNRMVIVLTQKFKGKKIDTTSLCYFINYLVGSLGLTPEDFEEFHRRLRDVQGDDEDESD
jgi:hypothetical protein